MTALPSRQNPGRPRFAHVREVFSALGGVRVIAACAGEKVTTVSGWRARNSIPVEHWPALLASGPAGLIGLTSDDLMHACTGAEVHSREASGQGEGQAAGQGQGQDKGQDQGEAA